ncbi:TadE/TadG family type IV pilus assembly protein [Kordiimonas lacus]|nr:TadE family protein [Kordiimonas lacus]
MQKFRTDQEGSIAVETAAIMTVIALISIGVVDFGLAYARNMQLANAARAGMQYALVRKPVQGDYSGIIAAVEAAAPAAEDGSGRTVTATLYCECPDGTASDCTTTSDTDITCSDGTLRKAYLDVTISETYDLLLRYPAFSDSVNLSQTATARLN